MRLVTYNVRYGIGRDGRFDLARIAAAVEGADIMALQEVTRNFAQNGGADMVAGLAALLPDHFFVFAPTMDVDFGARGPDGRPANRRFEFGNMVLARWPIAASRNLLLPRTLRLDRGNFQRAALEALVLAPDRALRVYSVHLDHVSADERIGQIRHLKERVLAYEAEGGAISGAAEYGFPEPPRPAEFVLLGDFNMDRGSPEHRMMTAAERAPEVPRVPGQPGSDRTGQPAREAGRAAFVDAYDLLEPRPDACSCLDEDGSLRLIDYCFMARQIAPGLRAIRIDGEAEGSDHLPVWFELDGAAG